jgi:hypothetical protein
MVVLCALFSRHCFDRFAEELLVALASRFDEAN